MSAPKDERFTELPNWPSVYVFYKSSSHRQLPFIDTKLDKWIQINNIFAAHSNITVTDYLN